MDIHENKAHTFGRIFYEHVVSQEICTRSPTSKYLCCFTLSTTHEIGFVQESKKQN